VEETKPPIVNQQCVVYSFQCDLCDAGYVGYTREHLHNRVKGHKQQSSIPCTAQNVLISKFVKIRLSVT